MFYKHSFEETWRDREQTFCVSVDDDKLKPTHTCLYTSMTDDLVKLIQKIFIILFDVLSLSFKC